MSKHLLTFGCWILLNVYKVENVLECKATPLGKEYAGNINVTKSGTQCQKWAVETPHIGYYKELVGDQENYCRNPDGTCCGPWCYTMNPAVRWEFCDVPLCPVPSVTIPQSSYSAYVGDTVTLECIVTSVLSVTSVHWERQDGRSISTITSTTDTNKYTGSTVSTPSLTILELDLGDTGNYKCFATSSVGNGESTTTALVVTADPPSVTISQSSYSAYVGDTVTLECTVTSVLSVTSVHWERQNGGSITTITSTTDTNKYTGSTVSTPSLTILELDLGDTGNYKCFATSSVGNGQSTTTALVVTADPPSVTISQSSYSAYVGDTVTLECTVTSVLSVTSVFWTRQDGGSITTITSTTDTNKYTGSTVSTPSLTILALDLGDTGNYKCLATNSVGNGQSTATALVVKADPPSVTISQSSYSAYVGDTVTLECTVTSVLSVTSVFWTRQDGGSITTITSTTDTNKYTGSTVSTPSLTILALDLGDTGNYKCLATNSVGNGQSTATALVVTADPPSVTISQSSYSAYVGDTVTLECTVTSVLSVTSVFWTRQDGGSITTITSTTDTNKYTGSTVSTPSLTILALDLGDTGNYKCFATNSVGNGKSTATALVVTADPPSVTISQSSYSAYVGDTVTLECTVTSVLSVTSVHWERQDGGSITTITSNTDTNKCTGSTVSTPSLTILELDLGDTGNYTCFATSSVGNGQSNTTALVVTAATTTEIPTTIFDTTSDSTTKVTTSTTPTKSQKTTNPTTENVSSMTTRISTSVQTTSSTDHQLTTESISIPTTRLISTGSLSGSSTYEQTQSTPYTTKVSTRDLSSLSTFEKQQSTKLLFLSTTESRQSSGTTSSATLTQSETTTEQPINSSTSTCGTPGKFYSCPCILSNYTDEEVDLAVEELKRILTVDKKSTSSYKRTLTCAKDERKSARNIGYVGAVILCVPFVLMVINDFVSFCTQCTFARANKVTSM